MKSKVSTFMLAIGCEMRAWYAPLVVVDVVTETWSVDDVESQADTVLLDVCNRKRGNMLAFEVCILIILLISGVRYLPELMDSIATVFGRS